MLSPNIKPSRLRLIGFSALALACSLTAWACGDNDNTTTAAPCDTVYAGLCDDQCSADFNCPDGLHCNDGFCFAECTPGGNECAPPSLCDAKGRCQGGGSDGGGGGGMFNPQGSGGASTSSGGNGGAGGDCGSVDVSFEPQTPTVVLLIDQSGSMSQGFGGQSRWNVVYDALMNPNNGVVKSLEGKVRFALALYTWASGSCPALVEVTPPALNNHSNIDAVYSQQLPLANTPTGDSIAAITPGLVAFNEPGPKLIILATDGDPDRCGAPDGHDNISKQLVVDKVTDAYNQNIETVIIAVGDQVSAHHQQDVANAGKGLPAPPNYPCTNPAMCAPTYEPTTKQALINAFTDIINGQRTCVFNLDGQVIPGKECEGTVTINGQEITCNGADGWKLNGVSEIEFVGAACDTIMNDANVMIAASFPCGSIVP
ncbi:MAG TPA: VWA domain-containing protein, partial [Sorangium sp.]|nr:VWA domain-containing protein [Sorangium sp.]